METPPTIEAILDNVAPSKSKSVYDKAWDTFKATLKAVKKIDDDFDSAWIPGEEDYIQYFHHLHNERKMKSSSLWSIYSRLNNNHQRKFGIKLQTWPRITLLLKQYEAGYTRKTAQIFSKEQIFDFLKVDESSSYWILRKCATALAYYGGLRCAELKSIKYGNVKKVCKSESVILIEV